MDESGPPTPSQSSAPSPCCPQLSTDQNITVAESLNNYTPYNDVNSSNSGM